MFGDVWSTSVWTGPTLKCLRQRRSSRVLHTGVLALDLRVAGVRRLFPGTRLSGTTSDYCVQLDSRCISCRWAVLWFMDVLQGASVQEPRAKAHVAASSRAPVDERGGAKLLSRSSGEKRSNQNSQHEVAGLTGSMSPRWGNILRRPVPSHVLKLIWCSHQATHE